MKFNLKTILIIVVVIIILVVIFSFTSPSKKEDEIKKKEIDNMFAIWMNIAGPGDRLTLTHQEALIKKDIYDKLTNEEVIALKNYSMSVHDLLSVKSTPLNPLFISSIAYLTTNFKAAKEIVSKTSASSIFANFGFGSVPSANKSV